MEDPLVARDTDKVRFFQSSSSFGSAKGLDSTWRDVYPADFKSADEATIAREKEERQRIRDVVRDIEPFCFVCGDFIPLHLPDYLYTDPLGRKIVAHVACRVHSSAKGGVWKLRHCQPEAIETEGVEDD